MRGELFFALVSALVALASSTPDLEAHKDNFEPLVAIKRGYPVLHLRVNPNDPEGRSHVWRPDPMADDEMDTNFTKVLIYKYCKKVYHEKDVTNVMEGEEVEINNWCPKGLNVCPKSVYVRPWRCLVGPFQSDALLVPDRCHFNHLHLPQGRKDASEFLEKLAKSNRDVDFHLDALAARDKATPFKRFPNSDSQRLYKFWRSCLDMQFWNITARASCERTYGSSFRMFSYSPLLACGLDEWQGVEYVCCHEKDIPKRMTEKQPHIPMGGVHETGRTPKPSKQQIHPKTQETPLKPHLLGHWGEHAEAIAPHHYRNEHTRFLDETRLWKQKYEETVSGIVKDFTNARMQVQEMRNKGDIKGAEKLNREINARYKKTYDAVEAEGAAEKKQIVARHRARVDASLNERKRKTMEELNLALTSTKPQPKKILRAVISYVKAEEKDRIHIINRFQHLRNTNPEEAERVHPLMTDRLRNIDRRIQSYLARVDAMPASVAKEIRPDIDELLNSYSDVDEDEHLMMEEVKDDLSPSADEILEKFQEEAMKKKEAEEAARRRKEEENRVNALREKERKRLVDEQAAAMINDMNRDEIPDSSDDEFDDDEEEYEEDEDDEDDEEDEEEEGHNGNAPPGLVRVKLNRDDSAKKIFDPETMEDEHNLEEDPRMRPSPAKQPHHKTKPAPFVAHMSSHEFNVHRENQVKEAVRHSGNQTTGSVGGLLATGAGILLILVVAIVLLRKRKAPRQPLNTGFVEVDSKGFTPEERHVHNMQMNGYENPTYRYFEMSN